MKESCSRNAPCRLARLLAAWVLLCGVAPAPLRAQSPGFAPIVLTTPGSTRALALGNAFVLGPSDSDAIFYNPAVAEQLRGISVAWQMQPQPGADDARLVTASGGAEWWGGAVAVGVRALSYEAGGGGPGASSTAASGLVAAIAHARRIKGVRLAATGKLVEQRVGDARAAAAAVDLAGALSAGPLWLGLSVQDLGPDLDFESPGPDAELPRRATLSAATRSRPVGPLDILAAAAVTSDFDGDITAGGGIDASYWPIQGRTFSGRVGLLRETGGDVRLSAGAGFAGDRIAIEYAYIETDGGSHRLGVRWR